MPTTRAPWTTAMLDALNQADDGLTVDELLTIGMRAVPPGRALQQRERRAASNRDGSNGPRKKITKDEAIRYGARDLCRVALAAMVKRGRVERDGDRVGTTR